MLKSILPFFAMLLSLSTMAQNSEVKGTIRDTSGNSSLKNAVIAILTPKDSVLRNFTRTASDGSYSLKNVPAGNYILLVMHPAFADYVEDIEVKSTSLAVGPISVTPKSKLMEAIILKSGSPMRIKGDTTIYT
ncbi:MAG: carboxypeptidase regulatory-like domain-containing protein, partial [Pedobacter sp.]